jgi:hypothetical protein
LGRNGAGGFVPQRPIGRALERGAGGGARLQLQAGAAGF